MTMNRLEALRGQEGVSVVYDGLCPFCSAYTHMLRLRESAGPVRLVDARGEPALAADLAAAGSPVNDGMAVLYAGRLYYGGDAVHLLALLASDSGLANRLVARLLRSQTRARLAYPVLRAGRNLALRLLGRPPI
jgi:predicted DCC family thiol-disulfide oxidoreductase YuxK